MIKSGGHPGGLFYRRKLLLALVQTFGGRLSKMDLQKFLFLLTRQQSSPSFEFIPYKFGCYSFQCAADKRTMMKYGLLGEEDDWVKKSPRNFLNSISIDDRQLVLRLHSKLGHLSGDPLIKYVYTEYPYYAIKSTIAQSILSAPELERVHRLIPNTSGTKLATIGYEGKTLELYLRELIDNGIQVLCDVRRNAISMKFGFSKNQLRNAVEGLGISYLHLPELGIDSAKRKNLTKESDYLHLFEHYERHLLPTQRGAIEKIADLVKTFDRVALTCFELDPRSCHRSRTASAVAACLNWRVGVDHI